MIEPGQLSQWRDTAAVTAQKAKEHAERLELRGRAEDEIAIRDEYLTLLDLKPGAIVLDAGCGSGVVTRAIAARVAPGGRVVGIDASSAMIALARELADSSKLGECIEFRSEDCRKLSFADATFDLSFAATTLAHVPDAARALAEMFRVTRPGGRVAVFDFDSDSTLIAHPDRELTRRIVRAFADYGAVDGWLARSLPGHFRDLGLQDIRARGFMPLESAGYYAKLPERAAEVARAAGEITAEEEARWLAAHHANVTAGRFLGGRLHLLVWGTKPR